MQNYSDVFSECAVTQCTNNITGVKFSNVQLVLILCAHFFIFCNDHDQRQLSPALEVSTSQVLFSLEKQMQMQILSQEIWSVSPGSTAHLLTSRVINFKHYNCLCRVHLKDNLMRNQNSTQKFKFWKTLLS